MSCTHCPRNISACQYFINTKIMDQKMKTKKIYFISLAMKTNLNNFFHSETKFHFGPQVRNGLPLLYLMKQCKYKIDRPDVFISFKMYRS